MEMDKRYDHQTFDKEIKAFWDEKGIYNFTPDSTKELFSVDTPPPTVSGTLHIGHIFSYTHTDIIVRYKRMRGYNVFYPMGFDDNGLPTERFVEKKNSTKAHLMKRSEFIKLCLKESHEVEQTFADLWKTIGLSVDWAMTYSTISDDARSIAQTSFIDLYNKGFIYRKEEPALYCTTCQTTVAQAELDTAELPSTFNDVQFKTESGEPFTIATTRPELLPACVAMVYHPSDKRYQKFAGQYAITPIYGRRVPFIADDKIDPEKGTGIVMCCTFGDPTDIYWFKQYKLPFIQIISRNGLWTENTGILQGLRVHEARKKVLEALAECGALLKQEKINHNVPVHERCKQGIEYLILSQWFVEILKHKQDFIKLAEKIHWHPAYMRARYNDWVEHLNWDWCISRQRYFGIPFPVWHCGDCSKVVFADKAMLPVDPQETAYGKPCPHCGGTNLTPDTDVMDTWNTSSLTPQLVSRWSLGEQRVPMPLSMRPQAHDIIRTWAFYTIIKAFYHNNDIPWKDIVISGHVLAGKEKISKSKGNEKMTPQDLLAEHSADVIRFWTASGKLGMDTAFSDNQLKIGSKLVTKLWNALRFTSEFLGEGYVPVQPEATKNLVNQWLISRRDQAIASYCDQFNKFEYTDALDRVEKFFWHDFCDNYLELIKDQMQNSGKYAEQEIAETKYTIYTVGYSLLQLYAPFIPFVTEKLYQLLYKKHVGSESLHTTILSQSCFEQSNDQIEQDMNLLLAAIGHVRKLKSEAQCSLKTPIKTLVIHGPTELVALLRQQERMLLGITQAAELVAGDGSHAQNTLEGQEPELIAHIVVG